MDYINFNSFDPAKLCRLWKTVRLVVFYLSIRLHFFWAKLARPTDVSHFRLYLSLLVLDRFFLNPTIGFTSCFPVVLKWSKCLTIYGIPRRQSFCLPPLQLCLCTAKKLLHVLTCFSRQSTSNRSTCCMLSTGFYLGAEKFKIFY